MKPELEKLIRLRDVLTGLIKDTRQYNNQVEKLGSMGISDRKREKVNADVHWNAMMLEKSAHEVHCRCVEAELADPYPDDYYVGTTLNDGWHEIPFHKRRPKI